MSKRDALMRDAEPPHCTTFAVWSEAGEDGVPVLVIEDEAAIDRELGEGTVERLRAIFDQKIAEGVWGNVEPARLAGRAFRELLGERGWRLEPER